MAADECWVIEEYRYRPCSAPQREFRSVASLHNHSMHSLENIATLNRVMAMPFMRPFSEILQRAFGLEAVENLDYADVHYNPPHTPAQVLKLEFESVRRLGFDSLIFALTDHDNVCGALQLADDPEVEPDKIALGEELSVEFRDRLFHLGVIGIPRDQLLKLHNRLQAAAREQRLDELFELLRSTGCLVIINHPLLPWDGKDIQPLPTLEFIEKFGWAIDALEFNGMRRREENDAVLKLARQTRKPVVGGGDSHMLMPSSALCASRDARSLSEFIREVKQGRTATIVRREYYAPLGWKLFLRTLSFIAQYRRIALYKDIPIESVIGKERVLLDPVGRLARGFLCTVSALGLAR